MGENVLGLVRGASSINMALTKKLTSCLLLILEIVETSINKGEYLCLIWLSTLPD